MDAVDRWGARGTAWTVTLALHALPVVVMALVARPLGDALRRDLPAVAWAPEPPPFAPDASEWLASSSWPRPGDGAISEHVESCFEDDFELDAGVACRCPQIWDGPFPGCASCGRSLTLVRACPVHDRPPGWRPW